jgi:putative ABC transport system permease protein
MEEAKMTNLINISGRNLFRYKRRTFLTLTLIVVGVLFVAGFIAVTGSFKSIMIGQITDSFVGHMQIHRKGYLAAIDNLPLTMNLKPGIVQKVAAILKETPEIESYSPRIKFGGHVQQLYRNDEYTTERCGPGTGSKNVTAFAIQDSER